MYSTSNSRRWDRAWHDTGRHRPDISCTASPYVMRPDEMSTSPAFTQACATQRPTNSCVTYVLKAVPVLLHPFRIEHVLRGWSGGPDPQGRRLAGVRAPVTSPGNPGPGGLYSCLGGIASLAPAPVFAETAHRLQSTVKQCNTGKPWRQYFVSEMRLV